MLADAAVYSLADMLDIPTLKAKAQKNFAEIAEVYWSAIYPMLSELCSQLHLLEAVCMALWSTSAGQTWMVG